MHLPKTLARIAAIIALSGVGACATSTTYSLSPTALPEQTVRYLKGTPSIRSDKANSTVSVSTVEASTSYNLAFFVVATNKGTGPANLGVENVEITTAAGALLKTYTFAELKDAEEAAAAATALVYGLAGMSEAYKASKAETTTIAHADGSKTVIKSSSPAGASLARSFSLGDAERRMADRHAQAEVEIATLSDMILQTTTVDPEDTIGGKVEAERPKFTEGAENVLTVRVEFAGDSHEFRFELKPTR